MKHFIIMSLFAALVAVCFGVIGREGAKSRAVYGLKVFAEFVGIGLALAWVLYLIPW